MTANLPTSLATIGGDDLAGDQPIDQHADGGQVLLDRRLLKILAERLDIGGDVERLDVGESGRVLWRSHQAKNRTTAW